MVAYDDLHDYTTTAAAMNAYHAFGYTGWFSPSGLGANAAGYYVNGGGQAFAVQRGGVLVVCFKGSGSVGDLIDAAWDLDQQIRYVADFIEAVIDYVRTASNNVTQVLFTGHSLGGELAEAIAAIYGPRLYAASSGGETAISQNAVYLATFASPGVPSELDDIDIDGDGDQEDNVSTSLPSQIYANSFSFGFSEDGVFAHEGVFSALSGLDRYTYERVIYVADSLPGDPYVFNGRFSGSTAEHASVLYYQVVSDWLTAAWYSDFFDLATGSIYALRTIGEGIDWEPGEENDIFLAESAQVGGVVLGLWGNDTIARPSGQTGIMFIASGGGDDLVLGGLGSDYIDGGLGIDDLQGRGGNDYIWGGSGDDDLDGGENNDTLRGEAGNDDLDGWTGDDNLYGGAGVDLLLGYSGYDYLNGGDDNDELWGEGDDDTLDGWYGDDDLYGGSGSDSLLGFYGEDYLSGGSGDDSLSGENDNDTLNGGADNDDIDGGFGVDVAFFSGVSSSATWHRNPNGSWSVTSSDGADTLWSVEFMDFADRDVFLDRAANNFYGDGTSDIVFRRFSDGVTVMWSINGLTVTDVTPTEWQAGADWTIEGFGDFDRDGVDDFLLRRSDAVTAVWTMWGAEVVSSDVTTWQASSQWQIQRVGDFNGDGNDDILWRRTDGVTSVWNMDGVAVLGADVTLWQAGNEWQIQGVGDFDGDGRDDFLWRRSTDSVSAIWMMDGANVVSADVTSQQAGAEWTFAGVGDFNGDGRDDVLLRRGDGATAIWAMNGTSVASAALTSQQADAGWQVAAIGDYNGDGRDDILLRRDGDGMLAVWMMDGASVTSSGLTTLQAGADWGVI